MRHCRRFRFPASLPIVIGLTATVTVGLSGCLTQIAFAAPPVAAPKPAVFPEWTGGLPTPPQQTAPWTLPADTGLPSNVLEATRLLFDQGLADPRGCDYQTVTVHVGDVWSGSGGVVETHGWVLPQEISGQKFAVCWNGLVYPAVSVKGRADLDADVRQMLDNLDKQQPKGTKEAGGIQYFAAIHSLFSHDAVPEAESLSLNRVFFLKSLLLLRLNKPELARATAGVWEKNLERDGGDKRDEARRDPYGPLAAEWAWTLYDQAVCAHMRGADALALADTNVLVRAQPFIEAETGKRAYKSYIDNNIHNANEPYLRFLKNLPDLQKDAARRVAGTPRPPVDWVALKTKPQAERIVFLISRLDDVAARQDGQPGGVGLDADPVSQALIAEGNAAVEPLLDTMERDKRLTRAVSFGRDFSRDRELLSVPSAAYACFNRITQVTEIFGENGTERNLSVLRAWWVKNKGASPADRWFAQLADDGGSFPVVAKPPVPGTPRDFRAEQQESQQQFEQNHNTIRRWEEAAHRIVERVDVQRQGRWVTETRLEPGKIVPPRKGESLRARTNPSVSDVLRKRALQLSEPQKSGWGFDYARSANFALMLYEWQPNGAQTLPTLQEVMRRCLTYQNAQPRGEGYADQSQLSGRIARLTLARVRLGEDAAADEYQTYLQSVSPTYLGSEIDSALLALWKGPENPTLRRVAEALFASEKPSTWSEMLSDPKDRANGYAASLFYSDLLRLASFRALVLRRLSDTTPAGTAVQTGGANPSLRFNWNDGSQSGTGALPNAKEVRQEMRICDRAAMALQDLRGVPSFNPVVPVEARDKACKAIATYLKTWGDALGGDPKQQYFRPLYAYYMGDRFDYLGPTFPILDHSATETDVRANRAIFHSSGKKTRAAPDLPAPLPIEAQWNNDPTGSPTTLKDGKKIRFSSGMIWQAEDEWNGKTWTRYYGYIGPHGLYKVPASEIEFRDYRVFAAQKAQAAKPK